MRSLNSQMVFEYIQERFRSAYKYFACPQRRGTGGRQRNKKAGKQVEQKEAASVSREEDNGKGDRGHQGSKDDAEPESEDEEGTDRTKKKDEKTLEAGLMDMVLNEGDKPTEQTPLSPNGLLDSDKEGEDGEDTRVSDRETIGTSDDLHYVFDKMIFTGGKVRTFSRSYIYLLIESRLKFIGCQGR